MKKILFLALFLVWGNSSLAEEIIVTPEETVSAVAEETTNNENVVLEQEENSDVENTAEVIEEAIEEVQSSADENTITYKVEKEILPVPECDDETLIAKTKEFLTAYFAQNKNEGVLFRRRKHFLLNTLMSLEKENVANYKTAATRPVSDIIVELQMNEKILEENMRLCKKASPSKILGDIYLLVYPYKEGYKVHVINLERNAKAGSSTFEYK